MTIRIISGSIGGGGTGVRTGSTISAINAQGAPSNGDQAILRVGTWPNTHEVYLTYNGTATKWLSDPITLITQADTWAMDLGNRNGTDLLDWSQVNNPVPFGKSHAVIAGPLNLSATNFDTATPTGVVTVDDTTSPHSFAFQAVGNSGAYLQIRDNFLTYTGKTATTFTGCAVVQGTRGTIPDKEWALQGYPGGWGLVGTKLDNVDLLYAAGLHIQERLTSLMNSAPGEFKLTIGPYWYQYDPGDGTAVVTVPPSGGMGVSTSLQSLANTGGTQGPERSFYYTHNSYTDWPLATPTKRFLIPSIVGKMEVGTFTSGSILDTRLDIRWAS